MDRLPFDTDFDWESLPSDPEPEAWVQQWSWLEQVYQTQAWDTFAAYVEVMTENNAAPHFGYCPMSDPTLRHLPVPLDMVIEEFIGQSVLFPHAGKWYRLAAGEATPSPLVDAVGLVSLTHTDGHRAPATTGVLVGAIDRAWRWTDQMVVTSPQIARTTDQPFHVVWTDDRLQLRDSHGVVHESPARLTRAVRPCPMYPGSKPGQMCRQYGGGWVSRAIVATGRWLDEHYRRIGDVGCDTCDGRVRIAPQYAKTLVLAGPNDRNQKIGIGPTRYTHTVR